jgi:hypothetical protein
MLDHHLQRSIVYRLGFTDRLRFSALKPDVVENKLFTYHLKKVMNAGLVSKQTDGTYALTPEGRRLGIRVLDKQLAVIDQPESVLFLAIRRKSNKDWLLYRRKTHPLIDQVGFMHCTPLANQPSIKTAAEACLEKTGIRATFRVLGGGFFRTYRGEELESFTNFTYLLSDDAEGELQQNDEFADYFWAQSPDFTEPQFLPNMKTLGVLHKENKPFFIEKTFQL